MRILHLEDDPKDAELIQATLEGEGIACDVTRVDTPAAFRTSLEQGGLDLVLGDYTLSGLDGISALKVAKEVSPDMPFIFVSRTLGEEDAIEALKLEATDYVSKTRLSKNYSLSSARNARVKATSSTPTCRTNPSRKRSLSGGSAKAQSYRQLQVET